MSPSDVLVSSAKTVRQLITDYNNLLNGQYLTVVGKENQWVLITPNYKEIIAQGTVPKHELKIKLRATEEEERETILKQILDRIPGLKKLGETTEPQEILESFRSEGGAVDADLARIIIQALSRANLDELKLINKKEITVLEKLFSEVEPFVEFKNFAPERRKFPSSLGPLEKKRGKGKLKR